MDLSLASVVPSKFFELPAEQTSTCIVCKEVKSSAAYAKDLRRKTGLSRTCKPCVRTAARARGRIQRWSPERWQALDPEARQWICRVRHWRASGKKAETRPIAPNRTCQICNESKSLTEFQFNSPKGHVCAQCRATHNRTLARLRVQEKWLRKNYNIGLEEYRAKLEEQNHLCAICCLPAGGRWGRLCVDHNHATGAVRGLLCEKCNVALGCIDEDAERALSMSAYIKKYAK